MAILDWPATAPFKPQRMRLGVSTPKSQWGGFYTGQAQSISHLGDRLRIEMTLPPCVSEADAAYREAFLMQLASAGDWVRLLHFLRPVIAGRLRGLPVIDASAAAGARSLTISRGGSDVNLLSEVQAFNANSWTPISGGSVTANVAARPNSASVAADQVTDDSIVASEGVLQDVAVPNDSATYTASIYIRATSGATSKTASFEIVLTGGTSVSSVLRINTDTGVILSGSGVITSTDSGTWWRVSTTLSNNASGNTVCSVRFYPARAAYNTAPVDVTQTGSAIIWGAQLELGGSLSALSQPTLLPGDLLGVGNQLLPVAFTGFSGQTSTALTVPLALPLRQAVTAGDPVTWFKPTGNFQLLDDLTMVEYLPGRYQDALTLSFVEAF